MIAKDIWVTKKIRIDFLKNRNQQQRNKENLKKNNNLKRKSQQNNWEKQQSLNKRHIKRM